MQVHAPARVKFSYKRGSPFVCVFDSRIAAQFPPQRKWILRQASSMNNAPLRLRPALGPTTAKVTYRGTVKRDLGVF